ncbi:MAG: VWA domain-containing protein [Burkholderiales bacterium]
MPEHFHFLQPLWLVALVPLALIAWQVLRPGGGDNPWRRVVDERLLALLMAGRGQPAGRVALWLLGAGWLIAVLALANPTWERRPQPLYQTTAARVVVLELSRSMLADDLEPSRLARARFKVEDVLAQNPEGQTGLVVYAGDAFTVSPLTRDANTIRALLKVLEPAIMPVDGSRADLGLLKAGQLLRHAGVTRGQVLLIADGVAPDELAASERAAARLQRDGYRVSVLGVGTEQYAARPLGTASLEAVARAGGGQYRPIADGGQALDVLLSDSRESLTQGAMQADATTPAWKEQGPLLAVLLLPLAALAFRRNWLFSLVLLAGLAAPPQAALAGTWDDLWQRPDQQAAKALAAGDYARAAALATDAGRRGSAEYKRGRYPQALENFSRGEGADAEYNRGNALARLGRYEDAITAYDRSLKARPNDADALANKAAVAALLKHKQQQQSQQQQSQQQPSQKDQAGRAGEGQQPATPKPQENQFAEAAKKLEQKNAQPNDDVRQPQPAGAQPRAKTEAAAEGARPLDSEEQLAAEQWLRRIPDDPGGLLRRKFLYQYRQRAQGANAD